MPQMTNKFINAETLAEMERALAAVNEAYASILAERSRDVEPNRELDPEGHRAWKERQR